MKILIATGLYAPEIGGPATHTEILERLLPEKRIEVTVVPFSLVRAYPKIIRHVNYFFLLLNSARKVDVVYALDPVSVGLPALFVSWFLGKKFVLRVAGDYAWEQAAGRHGVTLSLDEFVKKVDEQAFLVKALVYVERCVARHADYIVVPSEYLKRVVCAWGIEGGKITVVYTAFVGSADEEVYVRENIVGPRVVSAGRLVPWKGFRVLIEVVQNLKKDFPHIQCVIIGDGPEEHALKKYAEMIGVQECVRFTGRVSKEMLINEIRGADVFVLNTGYEGLSHQLLEVMSLGVPIVASNVPGNAELLTHEKEALLIEYDNREELKEAIRNIILNPIEAEKLVAASRTRVSSFTESSMVEGVTAVFKKVLTYHGTH